jgi:hypothetical protein
MKAISYFEEITLVVFRNVVHSNFKTNYYLICDILAGVIMKTTVFWDVMPVFSLICANVSGEHTAKY